MGNLFEVLKSLRSLGSRTTGKGAPATHAPSTDTSNRPTVLVIDDDVVVVKALRMELNNAGFNVLILNSGVKGLEMMRFSEAQVQVVVLDFNMPQLDGQETLAYVRKLYPQIQVIGFTGMNPETLPGDFTDGVDVLLSKQTDAKQLVPTIRQLLGQAHQPQPGSARNESSTDT